MKISSKKDKTEKAKKSNVASLQLIFCAPWELDKKNIKSTHYILHVFNFCVDFQGDRISLNRQLRNHKVTISHISTLLGNKTLTQEYLSKCIYIVGMGNNDYINNYLMPQFYPSSHLYKPEKYATILIQQYSKQLKVQINNHFFLFNFFLYTLVILTCSIFLIFFGK